MRCLTILIVEDEQAIRAMVKAALNLEGYDVLVAENGQEAIDLLPKLPKPCLILLDLMMPVMNGWDFAEALEKDVILATIPVVVVTAFGDEERKIHNVKRILKKPIDLNTLIHTVQKYCGPPDEITYSKEKPC
jgi:two-component system chemotaxis response regulator CheY